MPFSYTEIIDRLCLEPLPLEGGYFKRTYESSQSIDLNKGYEQPLGTCIYFLLTPAAFSALHWLIEDEIYHFYLGDPVALSELSPQKGLSKTILGQDLLSGQAVQHVVNKNCWHGSRLVEGGEWALMGTTMAPGFTWEDFELGIQDKLISEYPEHKTLILELTREQD
ncbi:MAG: cupin domain-containing protein [Verrucomicrobia bacterium]|nr:cupin domain-containing protein [Verrucomicrobiota bacterium]